MGLAGVSCAYAFLRPAAGLEGVITVAALAMVVVVVFHLHGSRPSAVAVLVLASLVVLASGGSALLGALVRGMEGYTFWGHSPDGRYELLKEFHDPGAIGAAGEEVDVRRDYVGLMRHEHAIYFPSGTSAGDPHWLNATTVLVDGARVDIRAVPPVGWQASFARPAAGLAPHVAVHGQVDLAEYRQARRRHTTEIRRAARGRLRDHQLAPQHTRL